MKIPLQGWISRWFCSYAIASSKSLSRLKVSGRNRSRTNRERYFSRGNRTAYTREYSRSHATGRFSFFSRSGSSRDASAYSSSRSRTGL